MYFLYALAAAVLAAAGGAPVVPSAAAVFKSGPYRLAVTKIEMQSTVDYAQPSKTRHQVEMAAVVTTPEKVDAVAVGRRLTVLSASNAAGEELVKPSKAKVSRTYKPDSYSPVHVKNLAAEASVDRIDLTAAATEITAMKLAAEVIVAKTRQTKRLAAVVMEELAEVAPGLSVRIANLRMSAKRELEVTIEYQRGRAGPGFPFIESVYALDAEGKSLGGGRWSDGDVLNAKGKVTMRFPLTGDEAHKTMKVVAVTEDQVVPVEFELTGIFKK